MRTEAPASRTLAPEDDARPALRVLCVLLAPEPVPGPRYRVLQYLPVLGRLGLHCETVHVLSSVTARRSVSGAGRSPLGRAWHWARVVLETHLGCARVIARMSRYDRVLLYRIAIPGWATPWFRRRRADLVYDYDDALDAGEGTTWLERLRQRHLRRALVRAIRACAAVSTSNSRNAAVIEALGGRPVVIPTSVDVARFPGRLPSSGPVVLGWMGTPSTAKYLPAIEDALEQVIAARPTVVVRLVGSGGNPFQRLHPEIVEWSAADEMQQLLRFDVGLMPMPDTAWTRGKAALKALQYGAARTPTVASWTPTNEEILGTSQGALLCRTTADWVAALLSLIDDAARRAAMGEAAYASVREQYSVEANGPRLAAVLRTPLGDAS